MERQTIKLVCFDIDGVLTDGRVYVDQNGNESKAFRLTELDALNDIRKLGLPVAAITGEDTPIVNVFRTRIVWDAFFAGCKDKLAAVRELERTRSITREQICYIGDGKYDIPVLEYVGLGICPQNAIEEAKSVSDIVLNGCGGESCIYELYSILKELRKGKKEQEGAGKGE